MNIKTYTDFNQSERLAGILPVYSADLIYHKYKGKHINDDLKLSTVLSAGDRYYWIDIKDEVEFDGDVPCWTFAALYGMFPQIQGYYPRIISSRYEKKYQMSYPYMENLVLCSDEYDNLIDAEVDLILKLKERDLL